MGEEVMGDLALGWPQLTYLALLFIGIGVDSAKHGQPRSTKHNVWVSLAATAIVLPLLYYGGFFTA